MAACILGSGIALAAENAPSQSPVGAVSTATSSTSEPARNQVKAYLSWALARGTDIPNDGHYTDVPTFDAGAELDFLHAFGSIGRVGVGLRYAYGTGNSVFGGARESEHWVFVPVLIGLGGRSELGGLDLLLGVGWGGGALTFGAHGSKPYLYATGPGVEASTSYTTALGRGIELSVGLAVRALAFKVQNGDDLDYYMRDAGGLHGEATVRCGLAFDL